MTEGERITAAFTATHTGGYSDTIVNLAHLHETSQAGSAGATFSVERGYGLTVQKDGTGSGSVDLDLPGGVYGYGTVVSLTATADTGSVFVGWSGDATGQSATVTTTMTADRAITATFDLPVATYTLTVYTDGTGSGTVDPDPPGGLYGDGTVVTVTATADTGSVFAGWSGACSGIGDCMVTMTATQSVTATFDLAEYRAYLPLVRK